MKRYIAAYVSLCDYCQKMKYVPKYMITLNHLVKVVFDILSVDFAGPFSTHSKDTSKLLLACLCGAFNELAMVRATKNTTADVALSFFKNDIFPYFNARKIVVSDNASCFTAKSLIGYMKEVRTNWKTVLEYAPMSNGRAGQTIATTKQAVGLLAHKKPTDWYKPYKKVVFRYER